MSNSGLDPKLEKAIRQAAADGMNKAAQVLINDIKSLVPVLTGRLMASWEISSYATPDDPTVQFSSNVPYEDKYYPNNDNLGRRPRGYPGLFGEGRQIYREQMIQQTVDAEIQKVLDRFDLFEELGWG